MFQINCLREPDTCRIAYGREFHTFEKQQNTYVWKDIQVDVALKNNTLHIDLTGEQTEVPMIVLRWNGSWPNNCRFMGDATERAYGNLKWQCMDPRNLMAWYFAANVADETLAIGVMTKPDAFCIWSVDGGGVSLYLDVRCGGKGVVLQGKTIHPAVICQQAFAQRSAYQALHAFCGTLCPDAVFPEHPVYGSNNWYYAYGRATQDDILAQARETLMWNEGIDEKPYVVIDDCWQEFACVKSAAGRPYTRGNENFPDMPGLAARLRNMGCRPGIWLRAQENLDRNYPGHVIPNGKYSVLDSTSTENLEAIGDDISRIVSWGYELIKYDFVVRDLVGLYIHKPEDLLQFSPEWTLYDRSVTNAMSIKALCATIYQHAGNAVLIGCNVPGHLAAGYVHINRTGDDTNAFRWDRTLIHGVNTLAYRMCQHDRFYVADADCVGIVPERIEDWKYNKQFLDLLSRSGTAFFVSATPGACTPEMHQDIHEAFLRWSKASGDLEPIDWMDNLLPSCYLADGERVTYQWYPEQGLNTPWNF